MTEEKPVWVKINSKELESIVVELARKGTPPAKIGLILRDKHGIPRAKLFGKRISKIIKENNISVKEETENIVEKIERLKKHSEKNKHDFTAKKAIIKKLWTLNRLKK